MNRIETLFEELIFLEMLAKCETGPNGPSQYLSQLQELVDLKLLGLSGESEVL